MQTPSTSSFTNNIKVLAVWSLEFTQTEKLNKSVLHLVAIMKNAPELLEEKKKEFDVDSAHHAMTGE